jgi:hypothetical protein
MKSKLKILGWLLLLIACSDDEPVPQADCAMVACTQEFVIITVRVQDKDGVNIPLDDFAVTDKISGEDLTVSYTPSELEEFRQSGTYPLYDDRFALEFQNKKRSILFNGSINGVNKVSSLFVVGADCCHVSLVSGDPLIILK